MKTIRQPLDFFGVNIYSGTVYRAGQDGKPQNVPFPVGHPLMAIRWNVLPESLYWGPKFLYERYGKPVVVTENGMSSADVISLDGRVPDPQRIDFLHRYLRDSGSSRWTTVQGNILYFDTIPFENMKDVAIG